MAAAVVGLFASLYYGSLVKQFAGTMSVKYQDGGLTGAQIDKLNEKTETKGKEKEKQEVPYITGWDKQKGQKLENKELGSKASVTLFEVHGDMAEVIPKTLLLGSYVGKEDKTGCVVSLKTAETLFRSRQVIGCEVNFQNMQYIIRGVLNSEEEILMLQTEREAVLPYLELHYERDDYAASNSKAFLSNQEMPAYDSFTEGNFYAGVAGIFMGFPFLLIFILFHRAVWAQYCLEERTFWQYLQKGVFSVVILFLLAIIVKQSITFSDDFIPSKVSDFAFWSIKYQEVRQDYQLMLQYQTWDKEAILLGNLRNCIVTSLTSGILCFAVKFSQQRNAPSQQLRKDKYRILRDNIIKQ